MDPVERWQRIPGWPGYEASDLGRVRSVDRTLSDGREAGGVVLAPTADKDGYLRVKLSSGKRRKVAPVHQLVLLAFEGPPEVRHLNSRRQDNALRNLCYGSHRENEQDKWRARQAKARISRQMANGTRSVTAVSGLVSLAEAVRLGIISGTLGAAKMARWRDAAFPPARARRGVGHLYDAAELAGWDQRRRGSVLDGAAVS